MELETVTTRIPAFLWDALQDVMYQQDYEFLREVSNIVHVPVHELKRTLLGVRGMLTTIAVGKTDSWWEGELCPMRIRGEHGLWKRCGNFREPHGVCCDHRNYKSTESLKHKDDPYFKQLSSRVPMKWDGETVWVGSAGDVVRESGEPIQGLRVDKDTRMIMALPPSFSQDEV